MVEPLFTPGQVNAMRPHIEKTVDSLLDAMAKEARGKPVDIVERFALPVPSYLSLRFTNRQLGQ